MGLISVEIQLNLLQKIDGKREIFLQELEDKKTLGHPVYVCSRSTRDPRSKYYIVRDIALIAPGIDLTMGTPISL